MEVFLKEVLEISDNIKQINEDAIFLHAIRDAGKELKDGFMKMMQEKQMEIMQQFGIKETQNKIEIPE